MESQRIHPEGGGQTKRNDRAILVCTQITCTIGVICFIVTIVAIIKLIKTTDTRKTSRDCVCIPDNIYEGLTFPECDLRTSVAGYSRLCKLSNVLCCYGTIDGGDCLSGKKGTTFATCRQTKEDAPEYMIWVAILTVSIILGTFTIACSLSMGCQKSPEEEDYKK